MSKRVVRPKLKKKSSIVNPIGDKNILQKKVPQNPKYSDVKGKTNSGLSLTKLKQKIGNQNWNTRYLKKEKFKRIKRFHLARLMSDETEEAFLMILDLREEDDYTKCHLNNSLNYPVRYLSRSVNPFIIIPEIYEFKNNKEKLIVVYDYEEERGERGATKFFEMGFDNVVLLSGGLRRFAEKYDHLLFGMPPTPPKDKKRRSKKVFRKRKLLTGRKKRQKSFDSISVVSYATTVAPKQNWK